MPGFGDQPAAAGPQDLEGGAAHTGRLPGVSKCIVYNPCRIEKTGFAREIFGTSITFPFRRKVRSFTSYTIPGTCAGSFFRGRNTIRSPRRESLYRARRSAIRHGLLRTLANRMRGENQRSRSERRRRSTRFGLEIFSIYNAARKKPRLPSRQKMGGDNKT